MNMEKEIEIANPMIRFIGLLLAVGTSRITKDPSNVDISVVMSSVLGN